jgi:4-alpha-glucanotransferase
MTLGTAPMARASGILLHPTSLSSPGVGDLGPIAYRFVDWLAEAGQSYWQVLPLVPVDSGGSPYNGLSALAGNPLLVSAELLERDGLLERMEPGPAIGEERIFYPEAMRWKEYRLRIASEAFRAGVAPGIREPFSAYRSANESWLADYCLFRALRSFHRDACWADWPEEVRLRHPDALERWRIRLADEVERYAFQQFLFDRQWSELREYAAGKGIRIIGDIPVFVAYDSADVWAYRELFRLDRDGRPEVVSGVPPDYFSPTGQRWGNPLYRWDVLERRGYDWWIARFRRAMEMVDVVRIDHFRGFESFWEIEACEPTAVRGHWRKGPGAPFFREVERQLGYLPVIAEDLGLITREVEQLRDELGYPGMRVLQFAFDGDPRNPHLPANCPSRSVAYTGTHDNDTVIGWWSALEQVERQRVREWLGQAAPTHWHFIEAVMASPASVAIVPLQDVLGLGSEARMNTPGETASNWTWHLAELPGRDAAARLRSVTTRTGRIHAPSAAGPHLDPENGR